MNAQGGSYITVYADILFLINLSMDFLALYFTAQIIGAKPRRIRLISASVIGALSGTVSMFLISGILYVIVGFVTAVLMTVAVCGKYRSLPRLFRDSVILWGVGTLLGGIMTVIMSLGEAVYLDYGNENFLPFFIICFGISTFLIRLTKTSSAKKSAYVSVTVNNITVSFTALCDSGCMLTEPISGSPVIIAAEKSLGEISNMLTQTAENPALLKIRMIPAEGVCGRKLLLGFIPDKITIDGKQVYAVIAADDSGTNYGGFDGIVPAKLTK